MSVMEKVEMVKKNVVVIGVSKTTVWQSYIIYQYYNFLRMNVPSTLEQKRTWNLCSFFGTSKLKYFILFKVCTVE